MVGKEALSGGADARVDARINLFLSATVEVNGRNLAVRIRNLSRQGAMIESPGLPKSGSAIVIERTGLKVGGLLRWTSGARAGVQFDRTIDLAAWSPSLGLSARNQSDVDDALAAIRSGADPSPLPNPPRCSAPIDNLALRGRIGEELDCVARMLETASDALAGDPNVIARHIERLQELDMASQMLVELAALLAADDPASALATIKLSDLQRRLTRTAI